MSKVIYELDNGDENTFQVEQFDDYVELDMREEVATEGWGTETVITTITLNKTNIRELCSALTKALEEMEG